VTHLVNVFRKTFSRICFQWKRPGGKTKRKSEKAWRLGGWKERMREGKEVRRLRARRRGSYEAMRL